MTVFLPVPITTEMVSGFRKQFLKNLDTRRLQPLMNISILLKNMRRNIRQLTVLLQSHSQSLQLTGKHLTYGIRLSSLLAIQMTVTDMLTL